MKARSGWVSVVQVSRDGWDMGSGKHGPRPAVCSTTRYGPCGETPLGVSGWDRAPASACFQKDRPRSGTSPRVTACWVHELARSTPLAPEVYGLGPARAA